MEGKNMKYYLAEIKITYEQEPIFDSEGNEIGTQDTEEIISREPEAKLKNIVYFGLIGKNEYGTKRYVIKTHQQLEDEKVIEIKKEEIDQILEQYGINKKSFYSAYVKE
jgi:hypothetical protein